MSIVKRFFMVPYAVASYFASKNEGEDTTIVVKDCDGYSEMVISGENKNLNAIDNYLVLHDIDDRMIKGINKKEFSEEELKKFSFIRSAFSSKNYNLLHSYNWYNLECEYLVTAYETMCLNLKCGIINIDDEDWVKPFFDILDEFDFFNKFVKGYYGTFENVLNVQSVIEDAGI